MSQNEDSPSPLFENAIDSLEFGIRTFLYGEYDTAPKHAILNVFHSIELLLKELLHRAHPLLIYKNIDRPITDDSLTVSLNEIFERLSNLRIALSPKEISIIKDLQRRRNRIEHHRFEKDDSHKYVVGKALRFIYYFLQDHLETSLEEQLSEDDLYQEAREAILSYEELLKEAEREIQSHLAIMTKDDFDVPRESFACPECGHMTVLIGTDMGDFCFYCHSEVDMEQCIICGQNIIVERILARVLYQKQVSL